MQNKDHIVGSIKCEGMGELKYVMIQLSSNSKVHQVIDVIVVNIPKAYGVNLSRDWLEKLNGTLQLTSLTYGYHSKVSQIRSR